mgnify:CR=1 FL=1
MRGGEGCKSMIIPAQGNRDEKADNLVLSELRKISHRLDRIERYLRLNESAEEVDYFR